PRPRGCGSRSLDTRATGAGGRPAARRPPPGARPPGTRSGRLRDAPRAFRAAANRTSRAGRSPAAPPCRASPVAAPRASRRSSSSHAGRSFAQHYLRFRVLPSVQPVRVIALDELHVDLLHPVDAVDMTLVYDRTEDLRGRRESRRPPAERRVGAKDRPREVELQEIGQPIEDEAGKVLRARRVRQANPGPRASADMPLPHVVIGYPLHRLRRVSELLEGPKVRCLRDEGVSLYVRPVVFGVGDVVPSQVRDVVESL